MSNLWDKSRKYRFKNFDIHVVRAMPSAPVRWYLECRRKDGVYYASSGSSATFQLEAVVRFAFKVDRGDYQ